MYNFMNYCWKKLFEQEIELNPSTTWLLKQLKLILVNFNLNNLGRKEWSNPNSINVKNHISQIQRAEKQKKKYIMHRMEIISKIYSFKTKFLFFLLIKNIVLKFLDILTATIVFYKNKKLFSLKVIQYFATKSKNIHPLWQYFTIST